MDDEFSVFKQGDVTSWRIFAHALELAINLIQHDNYEISEKRKSQILNLINHQIEVLNG